MIRRTSEGEQGHSGRARHAPAQRIENRSIVPQPVEMCGGRHVLGQPRPLGGISMPVREHGPERECEPPAKQHRQPVDPYLLKAASLFERLA
jgi:hypothetical protein